MKENLFCPLDKCEWYGKAKPNSQKCYYGEPQCWKGWIDMFINTFRLFIEIKIGGFFK
jgi:hypothetical protein